MRTARLLLLFLLFAFAAQARGEETLENPQFGKLWIYRPQSPIHHVILYFSGDGGWNKIAARKAQDLTALGSVIVGIDTMFYITHVRPDASGCYDATKDLDALGRSVEEQLKISPYLPPILLGYSIGATLVYGVLVQAPAHLFAGAISMGFCPDMAIDRPLCAGRGLEENPYSTKKEKGFIVHPSSLLEDPWLVFQGADDAVCTESATADFVGKVKQGALIILPKVGHGFRVESNWMPEFTGAFQVFEHQPSTN